MASAAHSSRPSRESVSKRIGARATAWIWRRDGGRCVHCGCALTPGRGAHLDHLQPRAAGGADVVTNLALSCERCNSARQDLSLRQWAAYAAEVYGLRVRPSAIVAQASAPIPRAFAGRGAAFAGATVV